VPSGTAPAELEDRFYLAMAASTDAFWCLDLHHPERSWSSSGAASLLGADEECLRPSVDAFLATVHEDDRAMVERELAEVVATGGRFSLKHRMYRLGGAGYCWVEHKGRAVLGADGRVAYLAGSTRDVSEEIELVERLEGALAGRLLLLREFNHRASNNLQMVMSLLSLQAAEADTPTARQALLDTVGRVSALAAVNKSLQRGATENRGTELATCLENLAAELARATPDPADRLEVVLGEGLGTVCAERATCIALIVNELVTNALKHATTSGARVIKLRARRDRDHLDVTVADNGDGMALGTPSGTGGTGRLILRLLCDQLGADMDDIRQNGFEVRLRIPLDERTASDH